MRCQWRPAFWKRVLPRGMTFLNALKQRLKLLDSRPASTSGFLDLAVSRIPREVDYATKVEKITVALLADCGQAGSRLFCQGRGCSAIPCPDSYGCP